MASLSALGRGIKGEVSPSIQTTSLPRQTVLVLVVVLVLALLRGLRYLLLKDSLEETAGERSLPLASDSFRYALPVAPDSFRQRLPRRSLPELIGTYPKLSDPKPNFCPKPF